MRLKLIILVCSIVTRCIIGYGQGQAGIWYFGETAGLDFNVIPSVALIDGSLNTDEGCSTVCTAQGDLLFYTDGVTVYNKNHNVMANGNNLDGHASATQSSIIVQQPGSAVNYYVFTVDAHQNNLANGFNYSIVDLSQNGGLGAVTVKNSVLFVNEVCEKITAVQHANGSDFWVVMHPWNSRDFYAYLLGPAGLSAPVISTVGALHNSDRTSSIGYIKTSPDGSKLAVNIFIQNRIELFDFDTSTGIVSNPVQLNNYSQPYGLEFSPSGELLYVSLYSNGEVVQFDITSNNQATINSSAQIIGSGSWLYGSLQLAPDNRIYMAKQSTSLIGSLNLDVINDPDIRGVGCNFVADSKNLNGRRCKLGLPNFVTSIFTSEFAYQYDCEGDNTEFTILSDLTNISSVTWNFGDGTSQTINTSPFSASHVFPLAGVYNVSLEINLISGGTDNVNQDVIIKGLPIANDQTSSVLEDTPGAGIASGIDITLFETAINGNAGITYTWYSDSGLTNAVVDPTNVSVTNGQQFWVQVDDGLCLNSASLTFNVQSLPVANDLQLTLCEDIQGSGNVLAYDLSQLEPDINNDPGTVKEWFFYMALSLPVPAPTNTTINNGDVFFVKVSLGSESNIGRVDFTINPLPAANGLNLGLCEDEPGASEVVNFNLTDLENQISTSPSVTITWFEDIALLDSIVGPASYAISNNETLYAKVDDGNCNNVSSVNFVVYDKPVFDLGADITMSYGETKVLEPSIDIQFLPGTYLWQDGSVSSTFTVIEEGLYSLSFTDLNGCVATDSIMVFVNEYNIFVPNAFTPNGDGVNDTFGPVITGNIAGEDIQMYIYNRWGELIYEFTDLGEGWDGTYKGSNAKTGIYVWVLIINNRARQDGHVSLIR